MIGYKYPNKDRRIKVYRLIRTEKDDGTIVTEKHYVHPKGTELKAYMVGVVAQSQNSPTKIPVNHSSSTGRTPSAPNATSRTAESHTR